MLSNLKTRNKQKQQKKHSKFKVMKVSINISKMFKGDITGNELMVKNSIMTALMMMTSKKIKPFSNYI